MKDSGIWKLQWKDFAKGLILAVITAVVTIIQQSIDAGSLVFNWPLMAKVAGLAAVSYILKNLMTSNTGEFMGKDKPVT